jgi:hypothetical protein
MGTGGSGAGSGQGAGGTGGNTSSGAPGSGSSGIESGSQTSSGDSSGMASGSEPASSAETFMPESIPGLRCDWDGFGRQVLKIDISRLPRTDQLRAADEGIVRASDVKTVAYFVDTPTTAQDGLTGLKRFEISRAESLMSTQEGLADQLMQTSSRLLADEVVGIRFEFSDGQQWYENWPPEQATSEEMAAVLPLAVHVIVYLKTPGFDEEYAGASWEGLNLSGFPQRRIVVPLPVANADQSSGTSGSSSDSPDSNSNSSNSSSSSSNGTSGTPSGTSGTGTSGGSGGAKR